MRSVSKIALLTALSASVQAATEPQGIPIGGAGLIPTLTIEHEHDDNIFSQGSRFEESSDITRLAPTIQYLAQKDNNELSLTYIGRYARYWDSRDDDFEDHTVAVFGRLGNGSFMRIEADASTAQLHDDRGTGASEGPIGVILRGEPDEYDQDDYGVLFDFGREEARLGASLGARMLDIEYTNNRLGTIYRDREDQTVTARVYGRVAPKTKFFIEYEQVEIEYDVLTINGITLDSDEDVASLGFEWEVTGKTTGSVKVGRLDKDFAAAGSEDMNVWDVAVSWSPRTYSTFTLTSAKDAQETNGTGAFIEAQDHSVSWIHDWSERLHSSVNLSMGEDEYPGSPREDDRDNYSVGVNYDWRRWANLGFRYMYSERDSNNNAFDYERNQYTFHIDLSL